MPNDSKEGWEISQACDIARELLVEYLIKNEQDFDFVEVAFGGDFPVKSIVN